MSSPGTPSALRTPFLPSTYNIPDDDDRAKVFLQDQLCLISDVSNNKRIGLVAQSTENFSGGRIYYRSTAITRNEYQTLVWIQSLPTNTIAAGVLTITLTGEPLYPIAKVNPELVITNLYGTASKPPSAVGAGDGDYFAFMNQGNPKISFTMSDTTIVITSTTDLRKYIGLIFVNYVRNGL